jgi:hypothetical protein
MRRRLLVVAAVLLPVLGCVGWFADSHARHRVASNAATATNEVVSQGGDEPPLLLVPPRSSPPAAPHTDTPKASRLSAAEVLREAGCVDVSSDGNGAVCGVRVADGKGGEIPGSLMAETFATNGQRDAGLAKLFTRDPGNPAPLVPVLVGDRWIVMGDALGAVQAKIGGTVRSS